jgi:hypothetical protein
MQSIGNINYHSQINQQASFSLTLQDTQMIIQAPANSRIQGYLFLNYYIAGSGGLIGQITPDNAVTGYLVSSPPTPFWSSFGSVTPFTQLGSAALASWWVHFAINTAVANVYRVQFAQTTGPDLVNPTYILQSSNLFYTIL